LRCRFSPSTPQLLNPPPLISCAGAAALSLLSLSESLFRKEKEWKKEEIRLLRERRRKQERIEVKRMIEGEAQFGGDGLEAH
jgi:hypothetical protein